MPRNPKRRLVCGRVPCREFRGLEAAGSVVLPLAELEAMRLVDLEECSQQEAAGRMEVSRGTLQRLLYGGRKRVLEALTSGATLAVAEGGASLRSAGCGAGRRCRCCRFGRPEAEKTERKSMGERKMIIAVTYGDGQVFQHFGHTPAFAVYEIRNGAVAERSVVETGETGHGALAGFLRRYDVDLLICGGIGAGAQRALNDEGIKLVGGVSGDADEAVRRYLDGTLEADPNFSCSHHEEASGEGHQCQCGSHGTEHK